MTASKTATKANHGHGYEFGGPYVSLSLRMYPSLSCYSPRL